MRAAALAMALAFSAPVQAEIVPIKFDAEGRLASQHSIAPGKFLELCGKLPQGQILRWSFTSDAPLNFNIHYHVGDDVSYPVKQTAVKAAEGKLEVTAPQDYCWMWSNKGAVPAALKLQLNQAGRGNG